MRRTLPMTMSCVLWLSACASAPAPTVVATAPAPLPDPQRAWETIIKPADRARLDDLGAVWTRALADAGRRAPAALTANADLLSGDSGLDHPALPPGSYRCRTVRIGTPGPGRAAFAAFRPFFCYVRSDGQMLNFTKQTGTDQPAGWLYADEANRYIFLGTRVPGREPGAVGYGEQPEHDLVGIVERIGAFRWRLVLPVPGQEARLDIYELVPIPPEIEEP
jgi:hypothetical protein